jgi:hypothetical protein
VQDARVYIAHSMQYKGKSLCAGRYFPKGSIVYAEQSVVDSGELVGSLDIEQKHKEENNSRHCWAVVANILAQHKTEKVIALSLSESSCIPPDQWEEDDDRVLHRLCTVYNSTPGLVRQLNAIASTNILVCKTVDVSIDVPYPDPIVLVMASCYGLFDKLSRCNHSCVPNCDMKMLPGAALILKTLIPVHKGEDLTIRYGREDCDLKETFGFDCNCTRCSITSS